MKCLPLLFFACVLVLPGVGLAQVTYSRDVAPILQSKCQTCHRPDDIAPFALMSYQDAADWAEDIQRVVSNKIMPPWKPVPGHGEFRNNFGLTDNERATILAWVANGATEGDPADLPPALPARGEWQLGEPNLVLSMPEPFNVPRVKDLYRCFVVPTSQDEMRWIQSVEVIPGNRKMVHHVLLFIDENGESAAKDGKDGQPGYDCFGGPGFADVGGLIGAWVPGMRIQPLPDGIAMPLPGKARIVMQVHYNTTSSGPGADQTRIGLYYAPTEKNKRLLYLPLLDTRFRLQPGDKNATAGLTLPILSFFGKVTAYHISPHMHLLGRKISVDLTTPDGKQEPMILVDDWDFNWQGTYTFKEPMFLPPGSRAKLSCTFDNSADNPKNPNNPLKVVRWGERTEDEMCLAFLGVTFE